MARRVTIMIDEELDKKNQRVSGKKNTKRKHMI